MWIYTIVRHFTINMNKYETININIRHRQFNLSHQHGLIFGFDAMLPEMQFGNERFYGVSAKLALD